jgi:HD-like signal output (HDOD) protein
MKGAPAATSRPLTEQIRDLVERGKVSLPPLPALVAQLTDLLRDEVRASSQNVAKLVRNDPAVAATLLKWANSAAFGGLHPISNLSQAIARLGFRQVTSAVMAVAHSGHFSTDDPMKTSLLQVLWGHAVTTALAARRLAEMTGGDLEESFIAGLLHDAGRLLILRGVDQLERGPGSTTVTSTVLDELMEVMHTELGHRTLVSWHLPEAICDVALHHHDEDITPENPLVIRVQAADAIARKIGEHPKPEPDLNLLEVRAIEQLNLGDIEIASVMVDIEDEVAEVKKLL